MSHLAKPGRALLILLVIALSSWSQVAVASGVPGSSPPSDATDKLACDAVCQVHEAAVAQAVARQPEQQTAAARVRLRAAQMRPQTSWADPMFRLTVQELGIPVHMQPMVMLMAEQPLPSRTRDNRQQHLARMEVASESARTGLTAAQSRWQLRRALVTWQALAERHAVLTHHMQMAEALEVAAMRSVAVQSQPARLLALRTERASLSLALLATQEALQTQTEQLELFGLPLPHAPSATDALAPLPALTTALLDSLRATEDPQQATRKLQEKAVKARGQAARAELEPVWSPGLGLMSMEGMPFGLMLTVGVRWPDAPWLGQRNAARLADTPAGLDVLRAEAAEAAKRRALSLQQSLASWRSAANQLERLQKQLWPLVQERSRALLPLYAVGQVSAAEIAAAQHQWLQVELDTVALRQQWRLARANVLWIVAGGTEGGVSVGATTSGLAPAGASASDAMQGH
jgi:hypothetical protein